MNPKIKIVTDSTADLPEDFIREHEISVVPLYVNFPEKTYRDRVDLTPSEFYPLLEKAGEQLPKTSAPSINDFLQTYKSLLEAGHQIISIHISSGLSGTASIAEAAAKMLKGNIRIFDSKSISLGIGLQVVSALEMVKKNFSLETVFEKLHKVREQTEVFFSLDTLEYLEKGGRIGKVSSLLGSILKIKPVVRVENGIYVPLGKARNQKQAIRKMVENMGKVLGKRIPRQIAVVHGAAEEAALCLKNQIETTFNQKAAFFAETGPVIGVHTGPGTLGVGFTY
ncbi:MAG TPA: DegV family protein [Clostridia bacterium]|jgi:DegV family protein with EDD domain|nr:DegV family protein [Clostridia bacterium]